MNAKKDRYAYSISEQAYNDMQDKIASDALRDGTIQGICVVMYALEQNYGWKGQRLAGLYKSIVDVLNMPEIFGQAPTAADAVERLKELYGVELDKLPIQIEVGCDGK